MRFMRSIKFAALAAVLLAGSGLFTLTGCVVKEKEKVVEEARPIAHERTVVEEKHY